MKLITYAITVVGVAVLSLSTISSAHAAAADRDYVCESLYMEQSYDCAIEAVIVEKKRLNKIYMTAYRTLDKHEKEQLDKEQIAWLKARSEQCDFEHDGPMNNTVVYAMINSDVCTANETQKRSKVMAKRYNIK
ncbi:lysozyme inhibitor LprI family protein [Psychrobacter sp. NPDC078631]|uniref:lysozyme inhibitor LprI family protein n=1 Tax=Psychrobacter sp. NPDC078631 TaxID=3390666 RepID=UPI003D000C7E